MRLLYLLLPSCFSVLAYYVPVLLSVYGVCVCAYPLCLSCIGVYFVYLFILGTSFFVVLLLSSLCVCVCYVLLLFLFSCVLCLGYSCFWCLFLVLPKFFVWFWVCGALFFGVCLGWLVWFFLLWGCFCGVFVCWVGVGGFVFWGLSG